MSGAAEIMASLVLTRLQSLFVGGVFTDPRLHKQVEWAINELMLICNILKDAAGDKEDSNLTTDPCSGRLLRALYFAEDIIDDFLLRSELQSLRNGLIQLPCKSSQNLFSKQMDKFKVDLIGAFGLYHQSLLITRAETEPSESQLSLQPHISHASISSQLSLQPHTCYASISSPINFGSQGEERFPKWEKISGYLNRESDFVGRGEDINKLVALLIDKDGMSRHRRIISVAGSAGLGKTALVSVVNNRTDVKPSFQCRAWVNVSGDMEIRDILIGILKQVTRLSQGEQKLLPLEPLKQKLFDFLSERKYLIIVDDLWLPAIWDQLRDVFPDSSNGSRIILICRDENMQLAHVRDQIKLEPLNHEESWALFLKKARIPNNSYEKPVYHFQEEILKECKGSPLGIGVLGGLLSTKDVCEWSTVIKQAFPGKEQSTTSKDNGMLQSQGGRHRPTYSEILDLSYNDLPSALKPCFLYVCLFPRASEIPIRRLLLLWLAEGFVMPLPGEGLGPDDLVEKYFEELACRNMIEVAKWRLDGSPKTCRLPGNLHDVFFRKALNLGFFFVHNNSDYRTNRPPVVVRRLAEYLDIKDYPSSDPHYTNRLHSYISFNTQKRDTPAREIGAFLKIITTKRGFGLLRVLDLEGVFKPVLPEVLGKLLHLRYLGLRWTFLDLLPESVGSLQYLETLDVKHTNITSLPRSIWKAKSLRHLTMDEIHLQVSTTMPSIEHLTNLHTLWGINISDENIVKSHLGGLRGLRKLGLTSQCHCVPLEAAVDSRSPESVTDFRPPEAVADWIVHLTQLQSLRLRSVQRFGQPSDLKLRSMIRHENLSDLYLLGKLPRVLKLQELPPNLKILTLSVSKLQEDPMPVLGKLPHLNILRLLAHSYLGNKVTCCSEAFPKLRVLKLWMLDQLEEWNLMDRAMPHLRELEFRCCPKLKKPDKLQQLSSLEELILTNMPLGFVADVQGSMGDHVVITTNEWEFPTWNQN